MSPSLSGAQIALGSFCGLLLLAIGYELYAPLSAVVLPPMPVSRPIASPAATAFFLPPPAMTFAAINDRPIFSPGRKPVAPKPTGPAATPPPPPNATLIGVILDGQNRMALIKTAASPLEQSVGVGGSIAGWQVTDIEPDRIELHYGTAVDEITLEANRARSDQTPGTTAGSLASPPVMSQPFPGSPNSPNAMPGMTPPSGTLPIVRQAGSSVTAAKVPQGPGMTSPDGTDKQN